MYYIGIIAIAFLISFIAAWLELSTVLSLVIVFIFLFPAFIYPRLYPLIWTKNVERTEKYILKNLKDPLIYFYYSLANKLSDDVEKAYGLILEKHKSPQRNAIFKTTYALYKEDLVMAERHLGQVNPEAYRRYYEVAIDLEKGELAEAESKIDGIKIAWMREALRAELAKKRDNLEEAKKHSQEAFNLTRGFQRYQLYKEYKDSNLI